MRINMLRGYIFINMLWIEEVESLNQLLWWSPKLPTSHSPVHEDRPCHTASTEPGANTKNFNNFRPIIYLMTISKIIERLALHRLWPYLSASPNYCRLQSSFQTCWSTETALAKIFNDILEHIDKCSVIALVSLDISAAFDMVKHNLLLDRLDEKFGIIGCSEELDWILP